MLRATSLTTAAITGGSITGVSGVGYILGQSFVGVSAPADTTEDTLATISVPAGAMGANGVLEIWTAWTVTNNVNAKTLRVRFSGASGTQYLSLSAASQVGIGSVTYIANRGATNSQVSLVSNNTTSGIGVSAGAITTSAVDTTAATTIVITGQKATSGDTLTLEGYIVKLLKP